MTHLLLISRGNEIPESLRAAMGAPGIKCVARERPEEAETALERDVFDAAVIYVKGDDAASLADRVDTLRRNRSLFVLVVAATFSAETERLAFEAGADLYLAEPLSERTLGRILARRASGAGTASSGMPGSPSSGPQPKTTAPNPLPPLHVLRDFSNVLSFSLDYKAFTQHFILKLREHISFSRIGIFLEAAPQHALGKFRHPNRLECIASLGIPNDLVECFQLSRDNGIGRSVTDNPRILNAGDGEADRDPGIRKEFAILGCQLAVPINDRERIIGLAVLNGPVTNRAYSEDELQLLYLLMEELGLAIRNSRLHLELASHGQLIESVLGSILNGAIVIDENLDILYVNDAARRFLGVDRERERRPDFAELPSKLATAVHHAVEKGEIGEPFFLNGSNGDELFRASILPFTPKGELALLPRPAMILLEDFTKIEANKRAALENSRDELISLIAERFAHEIRNSLVPLSTHAQLIDKRIDDPKFQKSLKSSLLRETSRIKRFSEQMLYLAQHSNVADADIEILDLVRSAFKKAKKQLGVPAAKLDLAEDSPNGLVHGNVEGLAYALEEIFLNALQADPGKVRVEVGRSSEGIFRLRIRDEGDGFEADTIENALDPFFTTRNTGVGLGLSVARKVVAEHDGFLRLNRRSPARDWDVEIELPECLTTAAHD